MTPTGGLPHGSSASDGSRLSCSNPFRFVVSVQDLKLCTVGVCTFPVGDAEYCCRVSLFNFPFPSFLHCHSINLCSVTYRYH